MPVCVVGRKGLNRKVNACLVKRCVIPVAGIEKARLKIYNILTAYARLRPEGAL